MFVSERQLEGRVVKRVRFAVDRVSRDRDGQRYRAATFRPNDVPLLMVALSRAYEAWATALPDAGRSTASEAPQEPDGAMPALTPDNGSPDGEG